VLFIVLSRSGVGARGRLPKTERERKQHVTTRVQFRNSAPCKDKSASAECEDNNLKQTARAPNSRVFAIEAVLACCLFLTFLSVKGEF